MSSDYDYGKGPSAKELFARAEAIMAMTNRTETPQYDICEPKPFLRGDGPMSPEPPAMPKSKIKARKRKRRLQKKARRKNR